MQLISLVNSHVISRAAPRSSSAFAAAIALLTALPALAQPAVWSQRLVSGPSPRDGHAMAYNAAGGVSVLFGGWTGASANGETWEWNGNGTGTWTPRLVPGPSPREGHAMTYDSARNVCVLFGGGDGTFVSNNETWEWNGAFWSQRFVPGPSPRLGHGMAYDSARGVTVLLGGFIGGGGGTSGETWEWDGNFWTPRLVPGPSPRYQPGMAYDSARGVTVVFGGVAGGAYNDETWEWDGLAWNMRLSFTPSPSPRTAHAMTYDIARAVTVLFGGQTGVADNSTWEWDGSSWDQRPSFANPSPRYLASMAYDSGRGVSVLFGGWNGVSDNGETWEYGVSCTMPTVTQPTPASQIICIGGTATLSVNAVGSMPISYEWHGPSGPIPGATGPDYTFTAATTADTGRYYCVASNTCGSATSPSARVLVCQADFNCDGTIDFFDYLDFVDAFTHGLSSADINGDGSIDFFDYLDFVNVFSVGC